MAWLEDKHVKQWFKIIGTERTIKNYKREFPKFLEFIKMSPTEIIESRLDDLTSRDIMKRRHWEFEVIKYMHHLENQGLKSKTVTGYLRTVRSFFSKNGVKLVFSRGELKPKPTEKERAERKWCPKNEEVRVIYRHAKTPRDRALTLVLYQSGYSPIDTSLMRIEEFHFYDSNGEWKIKEDEHLYYFRMRHKTDIYQCTCLSLECLGDIRDMLKERGFPKEGFLFVSFRDKPLGTRGINDAMKSIVERAFPNRVEEWQTKNLRDSYKAGLLSANITEELVDLMFGHKRKGAKSHYGSPEVLEQPITEAYKKAFKWLQINGYTTQTVQARQFKQLEQKLDSTATTLSEIVTKQQNKINELTSVIKTMTKIQGKELLNRALKEMGLSPDKITGGFPNLIGKMIDGKMVRFATLFPKGTKPTAYDILLHLSKPQVQAMIYDLYDELRKKPEESG